jgi:hypothetical protein
MQAVPRTQLFPRKHCVGRSGDQWSPTAQRLQKVSGWPRDADTTRLQDDSGGALTSLVLVR